MKNDIKTLEELMKILQDNGLTELFFENEDFTLTIKGEGKKEEIKKPKKELKEEKTKKIIDENMKDILSENIGRYEYLKKDGKPMIAVGEKIKIGQELGNIVAVGVKIPVISNLEGIIEEIYVNNNDAVDYGKPLIKVKLS